MAPTSRWSRHYQRLCMHADQPADAGHFFRRRRGCLSNRVSRSGGSKHGAKIKRGRYRSREVARKRVFSAILRAIPGGNQYPILGRGVIHVVKLHVTLFTTCNLHTRIGYCPQVGIGLSIAREHRFCATSDQQYRGLFIFAPCLDPPDLEILFD